MTFSVFWGKISKDIGVISMRIISGCRRGHKLIDFEGRDVRPTTDRVKESIFNIIQQEVPGAEVLDMFAGSGALSFEALSRGAAHAVLIDDDPRSVSLIKRNISALRFEDRCEVHERSAVSYAQSCGRKFDLIFLDPPYNTGLAQAALEAVAECGLLSDTGIAVLESDNTDFRDECNGLQILKQKRYGRTYITIYSRK